ncbi:MAG: CRISPR-associated endonuclease Cas2 [Haliscomenobacter sp.]|jgi:CRISPR-associated endonuclease Cas2|nr:CRISPR-associated endonuclease Cas2 [Haliscomenobacter sp.]
MGRPKKHAIGLSEAIRRIKAAGIRETTPPEPASEDELLLPLSERIVRILQIIRDDPQKATEMIYLIMYDITDNKVRTQIAKYLEKQGCTRIQKSVFLARSEARNFQEIHDTLRDVNDMYDNEDSIILVPVNASDARAMKLIGKNVQIEAITDKPNTLFF